jgi:hypothetical protein
MVRRMAGPPPDGLLRDWRDIETRHEWQTVLLGNGLSINVWPRFRYGSLFEHASRGGLTEKDRRLFGERTNFERVLAELNGAIRVGDVLGLDTGPIYDRYRGIQRARAGHP